MAHLVELYADGGAGDALPVVFLHSAAGNAAQWSPQLGHLRPARRAVALEWRGHGHSAAPEDGDFSFSSMAADVEQAVDRLGLERFALVGHSGGGLLALHYAAAQAARVAGLLLVEPAGDSHRVPEELMRPFLAGLASDAYTETIDGYWRGLLTGSQPDVQERVMADLWATPKETVVGFFNALVAYDPLPALREYRGPALSVVTPANDAPFSLHNLGVNLPHVSFEESGHWLHLDRPTAFNRILDDFLAR